MKRKMSRFTALVLALLLCLPMATLAAGTTPTAYPTASKMIVDGKYVSFEAYTIDSIYYFKLRDIAYILRGTAKQFDVSWNGAGDTISLQSNKAYTAVGDEMKSKGAGARTPVTNSSKILLDGKDASFLAYTIEGNNYVALRDIAKAFDFGITWNNSSKNYTINTKSAYKEQNVEVLEVAITNHPNFHAGNAGIAVNPKNPDNLVYVSTMTTPWDNSWHFSMASAVYYSMDNGETWTQTDFPFGVYPNAGVATLNVDKDGTFYLHYNALRAPDPKDDASATRVNPTMVSTSTDGGRTWGEPVVTPFKMTAHPRSRIDQATGKYYVLGTTEWMFPYYFINSTDGGKTFSDPTPEIPWPTRETPGTGRGFPGINFSVHAGIIMGGFQESMEDKTVDDYCKVMVSRDDGMTWEWHPVEYMSARTGQMTKVPAADVLNVYQETGPYAYSDALPLTTADPTKEGRFALMVPRKGTVNTDMIILEVYITEDAGKTWTQSTPIITIDACRPWIEFGPNGELGVMWRTHAVDAYAVMSFDHGATFSKPVKLNKETHPLGDSGPQSDHWSRIVIANGYAYIGWSDCRGGGALEAVFARVPFEMFEPMPATPFPLTTHPGMPLPLAPK